MKHTVMLNVDEVNTDKFSDLPSSLVQMFEEHEDIITDHQEVRVKFTLLFKFILSFKVLLRERHLLKGLGPFCNPIIS